MDSLISHTTFPVCFQAYIEMGEMGVKRPNKTNSRVIAADLLQYLIEPEITLLGIAWRENNGVVNYLTTAGTGGTIARFIQPNVTPSAH